MLVRKVCALWVLSLLFVATPVWSQRHGAAGSRSGHFRGGYSNFHARTPGLVGSPSYARPAQIYRFPTYPSYRVPAFRIPPVGYYRPYPLYSRPYYYFRPWTYPITPFGFGLAPYPYSSVFVGPYWPGGSYGYNYGYSSSYNDNAGPRSFGEEAPRATEVQPKSQSAAEQMWLLALNDGSIRAVTDYWLEKDTLHYLTRDGKSASVPLSELDLSFTTQLNRERGLDFRLSK